MDISTVLISAGIIGCIAYITWKKKGSPKLTKQSGWKLYNSPGAGLTVQGAGVAISIPQPPGHLNYAQNFDWKPQGNTVRIRYRVTGAPILQDENDELAAAGLMIQRKFDNMSAAGKYSGYRWFCRQFLSLEEGEHEYTIPLFEANWGPTDKLEGAASFQECLANVDNLSVVFGGTGGRGHGVSCVTGGNFELLSLA